MGIFDSIQRRGRLENCAYLYTDELDIYKVEKSVITRGIRLTSIPDTLQRLQ